MFSTKELPTEYCSGKGSYGWFLPKETQSAFVNELIYRYLYFSNFLLMLNIRDPSGQVSSTVRPSRQPSYFSNIYFIYLILCFLWLDIQLLHFHKINYPIREIILSLVS